MKILKMVQVQIGEEICVPWVGAVLALPAIYILSLMWWIPEGEKYVPGLVLVALGALLFLRYHQKYDLPKYTASFSWLVVTLSVIVLYGALIYFWKGDSWTELRALLTISIYVAVLGNLRLSQSLLKVTILLSGVGFVTLTWGLYWSGDTRVGGHINPIPYATAIGAVTVVVFAVALFEKSIRFRVSLYTLTISLFLSLLITQTRGVILPVIIILVGMFILSEFQRRHFLTVIASAMVGLAVLSTSAYMISGERIEQTMAEFESISEGDKSGSIGLRFQMWEAAFIMAKENPVLGWGEKHSEELGRLQDRGDVGQGVYKFNPSHYHSQYLDIVVKKGFIGFVFFMMMLAAVLNLTARLNNPAFFWGGLSIIILYLLAGLTDVPFRHPGSIYIFFVLICSLVIANQQRIGRVE